MQKVDHRAAQRVSRTRKLGHVGADLRTAAGRTFGACGPDGGSRVATRRRLVALQGLVSADRSLPLQQAATQAAQALADNRHDVPFVLVYLPSEDGRCARLAAWAGSLLRTPDEEVPLDVDTAAWPFRRLAEFEGASRVEWPADSGRRRSRRRRERAAVFALGTGAPPIAYLVVGVSPHQPLDEDYRDYLELAALRVEAILGRARAHEVQPGHTDERNEFLAMLAHELRNPLAPIRNATELLRFVDNSPASLGRAREIIERQLNQLVRLMDDLLDASRISRDRLDLIRKPMDLRDAIANAVETSSPLIEDAGHELRVELPDEALNVNGDNARLCQIVGNLLTNAAQYTPGGGHIVLSAQRVDTDVVLRVEDDGAGIAEDMLPRIFDLFVQADHSGGKPGHGLGIGLTIARRLAELHDGTLSAASAGPGRGSRFTLNLPALPQAPRARQNVQASPAEATRVRILVADDNTDAAAAIAEVLRAFGHDVCTAADGAEAVDAAERFRPDLILLDIGMPRVDGFEACRRIRSRPWGRDVSICAVTGWGQASDRRRSREAGFTAHLVKPVAIDSITQLIERATH